MSSFRRIFLFHNASYAVCISQVERLKVVCLSNCQNCQLPYVRSNSSPESLFRGQEEERPWEIVAVCVFTQQQHPPPHPSFSEASSLATFVLINLYMSFEVNSTCFPNAVQTLYSSCSPSKNFRESSGKVRVSMTWCQSFWLVVFSPQYFSFGRYIAQQLQNAMIKGRSLRLPEHDQWKLNPAHVSCTIYTKCTPKNYLGPVCTPTNP